MNTRNDEVRIQRANYYLSILLWINKVISSSNEKPFLIGLSGPQGCGKSTLAKALVGAATEIGLSAVSVSIDDFYLTRQQQIQLTQSHKYNPYLQQRGYPGTHDIELGNEILLTLKNLKLGQKVILPRFDKSKHSGQGDRDEISNWPEIIGPLDFVILEGWMLGFSPIPKEKVPNTHFYAINDYLLGYSQWHDILDAFIHIIPQNLNSVLKWRVDAEERSKSQGKPGMTKEEVTQYIEKFILAYETYLPQLIQSPPTQHFLQLTLGDDRLPL